MRNPPLCSLADLKSGKYGIMDLADMHEAMDVEEEQARRAREQEGKGK